MIPVDMLKKYEGTVRCYDAGDYIYEEHSLGLHYFQIVSGKVKLSNTSDDGREFIQHIFEAGQCFGEVLLFLNKTSPANATALTPCT